MDSMDIILEHLLDPIAGSPASHMEVLGVVALHAGDLLLACSAEFERHVVDRVQKDYTIGSEDVDDMTFA